MRFFQKLLIGFTLLIIANSSVRADEDHWQPFHFLIGEWVGEGKEGQGTGRFSLMPDLGGKILVRRNHAELPAGNGRPAGVHDDLMVIYKSQDGKSFKAIYFDSEDHVINYTVTFPRNNRQMLTFLSDAAPGAPRFRLTYQKEGDDRIGIKFEIAPPGKAEFKTYLEGKAKKKAEK